MLTKQRVFLAATNVILFMLGISYLSVPKNPTNYQECSDYESLIGYGIFYLVISFVGICATLFRHKTVEWIYISALILFIIAYISHLTFVTMSLPKQSAEQTRQQAINGNWLKQYKPILQKALIGERKWHIWKECYEHTHMCDAIRSASKNITYGPHSEEYYLELGCCRPPKYCGMVKKNNTSWVLPQTGFSLKDDECLKWMNVGGKECLECDSCKAGFLAAFQYGLKKDLFGSIMIAVTLAVVCAFAFYAFNDHKDQPINYWDIPSKAL